MYDPHMCRFILNLRQYLGNNDRQRLDSYLQSITQQSVKDCPGLDGILKLLQSFFDKDEINGNDIPALIDAFIKLRCFDAVNLLKGFFSISEFHFIQFSLI